MLSTMLACCALLLASSPAAPYATARDQVVDAIYLDAPPGVDVPQLRALIEIQPGYLLDPQDVQIAMARLYALGRFSQVEVWAEPHGATLALRFVLSPIFVVGQVRIAGTHGIDDDALRAAIALAPGDEVDAKTVTETQLRAQQFLVNQGFANAVVQAARLDVPNTTVANFCFDVVQGAPNVVQRLHFVGTPRLPPALLANLVHTQPGSPVSLELLEATRKRLHATYVEHDFLEAHIATPKVVVGPNGAWEVTFVIEAGMRIALHITGNHLFSAQTLLGLVQRKTSLGVNALVRLLSHNIVEHYVRHGYPDATVHNAQVDDDGGIKRLIFHIEEGQPQRLEKLVFAGNTAFPTVLLQAQVAALLARELPQNEAFSAVPHQPLSAFAARPSAAAARHIARTQRYVPEVIAAAAGQIASAYRDAGFLQASVQEPAADVRADSRRGGRATTLRFRIDEGPQTFIDSIAFAGNQSIGSEQLLTLLMEVTKERPTSAPVQPGAPISPSGVEDGRIAMLRRYRDMGFLYARVFVHKETSPNQLFCHLRFHIEEGPQVRVARVLLRGNTYTRQGVIRSRITLHPGDLYRLEQAISDQRRISSLGVFSAVRVRLVDEETQLAHKDVVTEVVERPRQPIEVAPGLSTAQGPRLQATYAHINVLGTASTASVALRLNRQLFFDLFGDYASELRARFDSYKGVEQLTRALEREMRLGMRSPPLAMLPFDPILRADIVDQRVNAVRYSLDSETLVLGLDARLPAHLKISVEGQLGLVKLECDEKIDPNCNEQPDLRRLQSRPIDVGKFWILKGGPMITWDRRDNPLSPTTGLYTSLRYTHAFGEASRDTKTFHLPFSFAKYELTATGYVPLFGPVLALSARVGLIGLGRSQVPIDERFFLGGRDTVRGFVENTMVPQDVCLGPGPKAADCAEQLVPSALGPPLSRGANSFALVKTELRLPLTQSLSLAIFADLGNLWIDIRKVKRLAMRLGCGLGARYTTPVGAMAIDLGVNPAPQAVWGESWTQLHFSIGAF